MQSIDDCVERRLFDRAAADILLAHMRALAGTEECAVLIPRPTLKWWLELADLNPKDLVPRIQAMLDGG